MDHITMLDVTYRGAGSVSIANGVVTIDGKQQDNTASGVVEVRVVQVLEGVLDGLQTDASASCGKVRDNVLTGGSVNCDAVGGSVNAGGSVRHG